MSTTEAGRLTASGKPDSPQGGGLTLQGVIDAARRLDELSCARVVGNAADAVHAAQKGGQPLGTVTPSSIVISTDGSVRLSPGMVSPRYAAPEQLRGGSGDRRTDVFALGIVLWESLAHERLFDGASEDAIKRAVLDGEIRAPSELNANVPAELDAICKRALARDPAERYQSARVMSAEIDAVLGDAGYPESNEQIARYVARALAPEPAQASKPPVVPMQPLPVMKTAPLVIPGPLPALPARPSSPLPAIAASPAAPASPTPAPPTAASSTGATGTEPALFVAVRPPAPVSPGSSAATPHAASEPTPAARAGSEPKPAAPRAARTEILGSISPADIVPATASPAAASPSMTLIGPPPAAPAASRGSAPSLAPPEMPPPLTAPLAELVPAAGEHKHALPAPGSQPAPGKPTIATAETLATPQLAVEPAQRQLSMPPGITVAPSSPPAPIRSADEAVGAEDEPARASAPAGGEKGKDVLAGWGWSTGSVEAVDDHDYHDTTRANRKRLVIAIGGALGLASVAAVVAFAFRGSSEPKPEPPGAAARAKPDEATAPAGSTEQTSFAAVPPSPEAPAAVRTGEPAAPAAAAPVAPEAPAAPPQPAAAEPPAPEPARIAAAVEPAEPAAEKEAAVATRKPPEKPAEPKKPPVAKRPPTRIAKAAPKAQPIDPYASPAGADPATAYKTGLQQYARGDTAGALATFRSSLSSNPGFAPTWRGLGLVYEKMGNKGQARSAFKRYLQLAPGAGDAGQIRERLGRLGS